MRAYESTQDFKQRLAIAGRIARGEGVCSVIGAAHAHPCVVRKATDTQKLVNGAVWTAMMEEQERKPFDCTAAIEAAEQREMANNRKTKQP